jgi:hypothetical protein
MMDPTLLAQISKTTEVAKRCFETESVGDYEDLDRQVVELERTAREAFQDRLKDDYLAIAAKLEGGAEITCAEREALGLLIIGESKEYLKCENDFENWKKDLKRLAGEMEKVRASSSASTEDLIHLQALCREAIGVLPDITFYLREKERIKRFEHAMRETLDPEARRFLAEIIMGMMESRKA